MKTIVKEKYPDACMIVLKDLPIGSMFKTENSNNLYLVCSNKSCDDCSFNLTFVNVVTGKFCPLDEHTEVYPVKVDISYAKYYK